MASRSDLAAVATLADWCAAWRFVTEVTAARCYGVDVDPDSLLRDYDQDDVIRVLLQLAWVVLDSLGLARAAEVVRLWGVVITCAEGLST